jgi:hypothetical protein
MSQLRVSQPVHRETKVARFVRLSVSCYIEFERVSFYTGGASVAAVNTTSIHKTDINLLIAVLLHIPLHVSIYMTIFGSLYKFVTIVIEFFY